MFSLVAQYDCYPLKLVYYKRVINGSALVLLRYSLHYNLLYNATLLRHVWERYTAATSFGTLHCCAMIKNATLLHHIQERYNAAPCLLFILFICWLFIHCSKVVTISTYKIYLMKKNGKTSTASTYKYEKECFSGNAI